MWDNGDPGAHQVLMAFGDSYGYCGVNGQQWRYNTLMRSQDGSLANTISVPNGAVGSQYSGSPLWAAGLSKQIINSTKWAPDETGIIPGRQRGVDDELLGDRRVSRQWRALGRVPRLRPRGATRRRPGRPIRSR
jgi:hypothetical protein